MPTIDGVTAAKFEQGGWYGSRQYWNGTLSPVGVEHAESGSATAGQTVSKEVNDQTNPANQPYIDAQRAKAGGGAVTDAKKYLNDINANAYSALNTPPTRTPTASELKSELAPTTALPEVLNRNKEMERLREQFGVAELETTVKDLKAQEDEIVSATRNMKFNEEGKPVAMNVIEGRVSEEERAANERLDAIGRLKARAVDELNTDYSIIQQYVTNLGLDYNDAVTRYDTEFQRNLSIYNTITAREDKARDVFESDRAAANANLVTMTNLIKSGNLSLSSMSTDDKLLMTKLEVQAGLPVGFMSKIEMDKDANIVFTSTNDGVTQVGFRNEDGTIKVESYGTRNPSSTTDAKATRDQFTAKASDPKTTFPDLVNQFASTMSIEEIYSAYANSSNGKEYGTPIEDPYEVKLLYKVARGEITADEARALLEAR